MSNKSTVYLWPYELQQEFIQHDNGMVECKLSIRIIDGMLVSTKLPENERLLATLEEFAEFINVEAFNEHWNQEITP